MKVLVVSEPGVDGVFRYVEALCHFLGAQGAELHLAYSDRRGSDRLPRLVEWVEQRGGRTVNLRTANRPAVSDLRALRELVKLARAVRPDVIHSHSSKAGFLARVLPLFGVRTAQFYHPHAYVGMRPVPGRLDWAYNLIEAVLGRTAHTVVVSAAEKSFACDRLRIPARRVHLVHNGVDLQSFVPLVPAEKRRRRAELGLPTDAPILGFMGRSSQQKDPLTLYRAFARAAAGTPVMLFHVGKGELDAELDRLVSDAGLGARVFRCAYTATPSDFYQVVDGLILTSRYEGFSLAALEGLAANLPMILSIAPGIVDLLDYPLSHVWTAAPEDVDGFARGIIDWQEKIRTGALPNHRAIARAHFDSQDQLAAVLTLYQEQVAGSKARPIGPAKESAFPAGGRRAT